MSVAVEHRSRANGPRTNTPAKCADNWLLISGIKNLLRCDEAEVVGGIARYVISQHRSLRLLSSLVEFTKRTPFPALLTLLAWVRSFLVVSPERHLVGGAWIARLSNERRAIEPLVRFAPELGWTELKFQSRVTIRDALTLTRRNLRLARRVYKIARRLHLRFDSFKAMRVIELLGYYARYLELFRHGNFHFALTSNHSNPHGIAFNLAARKCGVPVVLISHGMPVRPVARLKYRLAVVHCEAAKQTYFDEGCLIDQVMTHGRKQNYFPMRSDPLSGQIKVGVFLCKDVNEQRLKGLIRCLLSNNRVSRILIRPHPKNLWSGIDAWIASHDDSRLYRSRGSSVVGDLETVDVVFGSNSSVLVEAVTAGLPSAYFDGLDHGSPDLHKLVTSGLIYRCQAEPDFDEMLRFYQRPGWQDILRQFANIDEDESAVLANTIRAISDTCCTLKGLPGKVF